MEPVFGERVPGGIYADRPGAYALILDEAGRMPVMRLEPGRHFLPGGGMEAGESIADCLIRELAEELCWSARPGPLLGRATQLVDSAVRGGLIAVRAHYLRAELISPLDGEPEHGCLWVAPSEALSLMTREADRWAISHFLMGD